MGIANFLEIISVTGRAFGRFKTYCQNCGEPETFKLTKDDGSHTYKCSCGCTIYTYHQPDKNHEEAFFIKVFVPAHSFNPNFKKLNPFEKKGFKKKKLNGKIVYEKGGL